MTDNNVRKIEMIEIRSEIDQSINAHYSAANIGMFESRYVRREDGYFIIYLSSQSGCDQACRMCHLTATGQNKYENATLNDFIIQAEKIYEYYDNQNVKAKLVHYNFMARGEALNNTLILNDSETLLLTLDKMAASRHLQSKHLISTIMPAEMGSTTLIDIFPRVFPEIYYSLYSVNPAFRKKWLAKALPYERSLELLKSWQEYTNKIPKIHFAFIKGQNDSEEDMVKMAEAIKSYDLKVNLNIVRYNPHSPKYGEEPCEEVINRNVKILVDILKPEQYRIVPKVGFDVKASCGMFLNKDGH